MPTETTGYTVSITCALPFGVAVSRTRELLAAAGFGIITEVDLAATLKTKLGAQVAPEVILGACNPAFAHRAITTEPSVATLVPCNVVVRSLNTTTTLVEAVDPAAMTRLAGVTDDLQNVVAEVRGQIGLVLDRIAGHTPPTKDR